MKKYYSPTITRKEEGEEQELKLVESDPFFDKKMYSATEALSPRFSKALFKLSSHTNATTIASYIISMNAEINPSDNYRRDNITTLCSLSKFSNNQPFKTMTRKGILAFLDSFRKPESSDPLHKWIGTYNLFMVTLVRFFKWLYFPDIEPGKRQINQVRCLVEKEINNLGRKMKNSI